MRWFCAINRLFNNSLFISNKTGLRVLSQNIGKQTDNIFATFNNNDNSFKDINSDAFASLATNEQKKERINEILLEYSRIIYMSNDYQPEVLTIENMRDLLACVDDNERINYYEYLSEKERLKTENKMEKKVISERYWSKQREKFSKIGGPRSGMFDENGNILYGLWHNTLVSKIHRPNIAKQKHNGLRVAAMFGQKLIFDLDYDQHMKQFEFNKLGQDIHHAYNFNKYKTSEPFDIHFTDCNMDGMSIEYIRRHLPVCTKPDFYSLFHTKSYLELFPKNNLVYITGDTRGPREYIDWYDPNDIYVIGGVTDMRNIGNRYVAYQKALNAGIRCYRIPFDKYIVRSAKHLHLRFDYIIGMLSDVRTHGNWGDAIRNNLPENRIKSAEEIADEDSKRLRKVKFAETFRRNNQLKNQYLR